MKVAINLALVVQVIGFCEGVALAERGGVDREAAVEAMLAASSPRRCSATAGRSSSRAGCPRRPAADVDLQQKDLLLALDLGRELGVPLPTAAVGNELLNACRGLGIGHHDFVVVARGLPRAGGGRPREAVPDARSPTCRWSRACARTRAGSTCRSSS